MQQYHDMLRHILTVGVQKGDRTGTGTISTFGHQMRFDLKKGFPLVTTKKVHLKSIIHELLWFLSGSTNTKYLTDNGVTIWDEWAAEGEIFEDADYTLDERIQMFAASIGKRAIEGGLVLRNRLEHKLSVKARYVVRAPENFADIQKQYPDELEEQFRIALVPKARKVLIREKGDLGRVYGAQWRDWIGPNGEHIDQITKVINRLKTDPDCRRLIVTAWQPAEVEKMALPPCHAFFQFWTRELTAEEILHANIGDSDIIAADYDGDHEYDWREGVKAVAVRKGLKTRALSCQLYQRSCDSLLGLPFNIASYALLTQMVAQVCNMVPDEFIWTGGDCHIYTNHLEQVELQLSREPRKLPQMKINSNVKDIFSFKYEDFELVGYDPHPAIKAPVAV